MSDSSDYPEQVTRSRAEFGSDAKYALNGVLQTLAALSVGYHTLNKHPPLNKFDTAIAAIQDLIDFTQSIYIDGNDL